MLSERMKKMKPSATVELTARVEELRRQGVDIISFNVGEPDFDTPENIRNAAKKAIDDGFTRYTAVPGIFELRSAVCEKFKKDNGVSYSEDQIVVSTGAKQALTNALLALVSDGDEVIIPTPCWVSYIDMVTLAGGNAVLFETKESEGFQLDIEALKKVVTDKTKAIIINTPNNPTGATYDYDRLKALGELAIEKDFYIISDEVYEKLVYEDANHICIASISDEIKARTITINGMSKAYAMTGWRIGYTASPVEVAKAMTNYQSHSTSNPNSIAQYAALAALSGPDTQLKSMVAEFDRRRRRIVELINGIPGLSCIPPKGAFYVMMNISGLFGKKLNGEAIVDSMSFTRLLLEDSKVAVVPGIGFGADSFVRLSYATNMANIEKGLSRIADFVSRLTD